MRFDLGTLDSGERSLPFGLLVYICFNEHTFLTENKHLKKNKRLQLDHTQMAFVIVVFINIQLIIDESLL